VQTWLDAGTHSPSNLERTKVGLQFVTAAIACHDLVLPGLRTGRMDNSSGRRPSHRELLRAHWSVGTPIVVIQNLCPSLYLVAVDSSSNPTKKVNPWVRALLQEVSISPLYVSGSNNLPDNLQDRGQNRWGESIANATTYICSSRLAHNSTAFRRCVW